MKSYLLVLLTLTSTSTFFSQIPVGYYSTAQGLTGPALKTALKNIIDNHTALSYNALWGRFQFTDKKPNGKVWDMYSDIPNGTPNGIPPYVYTFTTDQCGTYANEGDCYNREHSWPKSWFSDANATTIPGRDLFHIVPTDGKVNGIRDNYPFGEVDAPTLTTQNGGKLGQNTFPGYNGTVFEPIDEYKGDFARGLFYMSTRYEGEDATWAVTPATNKSTLLPWQLNLLMSWHVQDPVSQKEIDRNNAIYYQAQTNRNPYIDNPQWVDSVWTQSLTATSTSTSNNCFGAANGTITITVAFGQAPYIYTWTNSSETSNTRTNLTSGTYTCIVSDALGATFNVTAVVTGPANGVGADSFVDNLLGNITLDPFGGFSPYTYLWSNGSMQQNLVGVSNGNYTVTITDANGCTYQTSFNLNNISLATETIAQMVNLYPNPAVNEFTVTNNDFNIESIQVYSIQGKLLHTFNNLNQANVTIECALWPSGSYFIQSKSGNKLLVNRLIKN